MLQRVILGWLIAAIFVGLHTPAHALFVSTHQVFLPSISNPGPASSTRPQMPIDTLPAPSEVRIRDTNYAIPVGARFVAPTGDDVNAGTEQAPWHTLRHAVSTAPSGSTIVLRAGTYHESVTWYAKRLTLQPYPHEQVWLSGSQVLPTWTTVDGRWRADGWTARFRQGGLSSEFIDPAYPLAGHPDLLFLDGQALRQVGTLAEVSTGRFWVDYATSRVWIGDNPTNKRVEGATLAQALYINQANGSMVRGLGFRHYATHRNEFGSVKGDADGLVFEDNTFVWNAAAGLSVLGTDGVVRGNNFVSNGQLGLHGYEADRLLVEGNRFTFNNAERFAVNCEAGGLKILTSRDVTLRDNRAEQNIGSGFWCDIGCVNTVIVRNMLRGNTRHGIMYEISSNATIASNVVVGNSEAGLYLNESSNITVYNNSFSRNQQAIRVWEGLRPQNVSNVVIRNNILSSANQKEVLGVATHNNLHSAVEMNVTINNNAYGRDSRSSVAMLVEWAVPDMLVRFETVHDFRATTGQERTGIDLSQETGDPFFVDEAAGDYSLRLGSPAIGAGEPLPPQIATVIGVSPGVPVNLGALVW